VAKVSSTVCAFSPFQQHVFDVVRSIPAGKTMTYGQISATLRAKGIRACCQAVGQALRRNPYPLDKPRSDGFFVPCHRVVASGTRGNNGAPSKSSIGGFVGQRKGSAIERKMRLLDAEKLGP